MMLSSPSSRSMHYAMSHCWLPVGRMNAWVRLRVWCETVGNECLPAQHDAPCQPAGRITIENCRLTQSGIKRNQFVPWRAGRGANSGCRATESLEPTAQLANGCTAHSHVVEQPATTPGSLAGACGGRLSLCRAGQGIWTWRSQTGGDAAAGAYIATRDHSTQASAKGGRNAAPDAQEAAQPRGGALACKRPQDQGSQDTISRRGAGRARK